MDMIGSENCNTRNCLWGYRFEVVGLILIVLGVFLTLVYASDIGIGVLILVGGALCLHKHLGKCHCHHNHDEMDCCDAPLDNNLHHERAVIRAPKVVKHNKVVKKPVV